MSNGIITYCLIDDGSASPALHKRMNSNFLALSDYSKPEDSKVLLQSGFSALLQESPTMLSPAMQLNGDLAGFDDEQLRLFGEAERIRKNQSSFSSYTIEPDNRLCVISDSSQSLEHFLNTYGGVLEILPLLVKGCHPDFGEVHELAISYNKSSYQIDYATRSPVDFNKCTYCSLCGKSCPETCISETLYFDYNRCSFCRDCEKICPTAAIDIYAVEQRSLEIPALLILGEARVELPEHAPNVYHEKDLHKYFSTLFPCQVDEVIICNHTICQYSNRSSSGCDKCIQACGYGAISGEDTIVINALKCVECGRCAGICPTGALQYQRLDDPAFFEFFRTFPLKDQSVVVFGSEQELHSFWWQHRGSDFTDHLFLEYPRSNGLSPLHLIFMLVHGASHVIVLKAEDEAITFTEHTIDQVNRIVQDVFDQPARVMVSTAKDYPLLNSQSKTESLLVKNYTDLSYHNRRQKLSSIFEYVFSQTKKTATIQNDAGTIFHSIVCKEDACTQCLACLNECKIQALSADPASLTLLWTGSLCTGCSACIDVCPENALYTGKKIHVDQLFFQPAIAAQAEPMCCKECGKVFGTKKSFNRVMEILAKQKMDHDGHFQYCEDCRVIKLLESE